MKTKTVKLIMLGAISFAAFKLLQKKSENKTIEHNIPERSKSGASVDTYDPTADVASGYTLDSSQYAGSIEDMANYKTVLF